MSDTLTKLIREELAVNTHEDNEAHQRCVCDDCLAAVREPLVALYQELSDAAFFLPLAEDNAAVERFKLALHRLHVMVSQ